MYRKTPFVPGEYYHIFGRGNNKQDIFLDDWDYARFLFTLLYFQSPIRVRTIPPRIRYFLRDGDFKVFDKTRGDILAKRYVSLVSFALMPNHYHLLIYEKEDNGISRYMQRCLNGYAKFFNKKYKRVGHVFQGRFKSVHVKDSNQLRYVSAYIHRNPRELQGWARREHKYPWSSFQDYIKKNRWGDLIERDMILGQFEDPHGYRKFVDSSGAKMLDFDYEDELEKSLY